MTVIEGVVTDPKAGDTPGWQPGVRLGIDVGTVRIGVATSDPGGLLATPVVTVRRDARGDDDLAELARLAVEHGAIELVVGLPTSLSGNEGASAKSARAFAVRLAAAVSPIPVRLVDERLSTVDATRSLRASARRGQRSRAVVDQAAAVVILQSALDAARNGVVPGELVGVP
jgi:putative Holliday junction resolvase